MTYQVVTYDGQMPIMVSCKIKGAAHIRSAYGADAAMAHAANLKAISQYPVTGLFLPGTSKADRPGKTVAKPEIWADADKFAKAFENWQAAVTVVADVAGDGQKVLAGAVGELGKTCGGCHKPFRAKEF